MPVADVVGAGPLSEDVESSLERAAREALTLAESRPERALELAPQLAARARAEADQTGEAIAERAWGMALFHRGTIEGSATHLEQSVRIAVSAGLPGLAGEARITLAFALFQSGRLRPALAHLDRAMTELDRVGRARALAQRGTILMEAGRLQEALDCYRTALPELRHAGDRLWIYRTVWNLATIETYRHDFAAAEADMRLAKRLAEELGLTLAAAYVESNLGYMLGQRGDVPAALECFDQAETVIRAQGAQVGTLLEDRAGLLLSALLTAEAQEVAREAIGELTREGRLVKLPEVRLLLAQAAAANGDLAAAAEQAAAAAAEFGRQRRPQWRAMAALTAARARLSWGADGIDLAAVGRSTGVLTRAGWATAVEGHLISAEVLTAARRLRDARRHLRAASTARSGRRPATLRARAWYAEALLRSVSGDRRGTQSAIRVGLRILDEYRDALGATDLRAHVAGHRRDLVRLGLSTALASGRVWEVLAWAERGRASHLMRRAPRPPDDPEHADDLALLRATVREEYEARSEGRDVGPLLQRQVRLERRVRDRVRRARAATGRPEISWPVGRAALVSGLGDLALIEYVQTDRGLLGLTLVDGRLRLRRLDAGVAVGDLVDRVLFALRRLITRSDPDPAVLSLLRHAAARLDAILLADVPELRDRGLVVVPTRALHHLPWAVLPSCRFRAVAVAPSATLWQHAMTRPAPAGSVPLVAAGPLLRGAEYEAAAVAAVHGVDPLLGSAATVERVVAGLDSAPLGHLAAHGRLSAGNPLLSHLELADGPLFVHDLERLYRMPATVVVAACEGGRSVADNGDEVLGLSATLLSQGSAQLVAPVLPVPDLETSTLMVALHRHLAAGLPPARALAAATYEVTDPRTGIGAGSAFLCLGAGYNSVGPVVPRAADGIRRANGESARRRPSSA
jgi:tetratricopeptide (TPR) repeat protein